MNSSHFSTVFIFFFLFGRLQTNLSNLESENQALQQEIIEARQEATEASSTNDDQLNQIIRYIFLKDSKGN